jgi:hypothetical protein
MVSMSKLFDGLGIAPFDGLPATGAYSAQSEHGFHAIVSARYMSGAEDTDMESGVDRRRGVSHPIFFAAAKSILHASRGPIPFHTERNWQ